MQIDTDANPPSKSLSEMKSESSIAQVRAHTYLSVTPYHRTLRLSCVLSQPWEPSANRLDLVYVPLSEANVYSSHKKATAGKKRQQVLA